MSRSGLRKTLPLWSSNADHFHLRNLCRISKPIIGLGAKYWAYFSPFSGSNIENPFDYRMLNHILLKGTAFAVLYESLMNYEKSSKP